MAVGSQPKKDLIELWKRIIFNMAVSNTDDHLRKGIKTSIYYASVTMSENNIYVEFAGDENESELLKKDLADILRKLIENGEFDLSIIRE